MVAVRIDEVCRTGHEHTIAVPSAQPVPDINHLRGRLELLADMKWTCEASLLLCEDAVRQDTCHRASPQAGVQ